MLAPAPPPAVIARLHRAMNAHDLEALCACYSPEYESIHPLEPARNFRGLAALRASWGALFASVPALQCDLRRVSLRGDRVHTRWHWCGVSTDGFPYESNGLIVFTLSQDRIVRAHIFTEPVETLGPDWEAVLKELLDGE